MNEGKLVFEIENLTETQKRNEYIMTSLRTIEGMDINRVGPEILPRLEKYITEGYLVRKADRILLTDQGKLLADGIAADLFD